MKYVRLAARNADDHKGNGTFEIYYSVGGTHRDNFIRLKTVTTTEQWQDVMCELPEGTEYIGLAKAAGNPDQYIDGVSFYKEAEEQSLRIQHLSQRREDYRFSSTGHLLCRPQPADWSL